MAVETIERLRYYQWQYLGAQDLEDQQAYHRDMRRRHNLGHHTWGIVVGLELETGTDPGDIYVRPGMAVDGFGREIVVFRPRKLNPDDLGPCKEGKYGDVWIAYEEKLTRPPSKGYELCGEENERRRVQEVYRIVVCARTRGDDRTLDHDTVIVAGQKMDSSVLPQEGDPSEGPTELTIPPDESVPYQEFPDDEAEPYWPIYLGTVSWDSAQEEFTVDGTEREYVGSVAAQVLAPDGTLRIRDRKTDPLRSDYIDADHPDPDAVYDAGAAVALEGSLKVHRLLTAKEDVQIHGGKLGFRDDAGKAGQDDGYPLTIARSGNDLQVQLGKSGDSADLSRLVVGPQVDSVFHEKLVVQSDGDVRINGNLSVQESLDTGDVTVDGNLVVKEPGQLGIGTETPDTSLHVSVGSDLTLENGTGYLVIGRVDSQNLVMDDNEIQARKNGEASALYLQREGGDLIVSRPGNRFVVTETGRVGIGTEAPQTSLQINGPVRGNQQGALRISTGSGWIDIGPRTTEWSHFRTDRQKYFFDKEIRVGSGKVGSESEDLSLCTSGQARIIVKHTNGQVGIGTTSPAGKLDVNGRILRKGQAFSLANVASHQDIVTVPWGTRNDWNIFVSPKYMGDEESGSEADNALLKIECHAEPVTGNDTQWRIIARYKFHYWPHDNSEHPNGVWSDSGQSNMDPPEVNYILVPK